MSKSSWRCPACGAKLVVRNLSHACGAFSVERFLEGKSARGVALFERFRAMVEAAGPCELAPAKTRVAFVREVRFASVNRVGATSIDVHFVLPRRIESPRIRRVEVIGRVFVHHIRLAGEADLDDELASWLRASRAEYGERAWLAR